MDDNSTDDTAAAARRAALKYGAQDRLTVVSGVPLPQSYVAPEVFVAAEYNPGEDEVEEVITPVELPVRATTLRDSKMSLKPAASATI